jgi:hypothetical protein
MPEASIEAMAKRLSNFQIQPLARKCPSMARVGYRSAAIPKRGVCWRHLYASYPPFPKPLGRYG